MKGQLRIGRLGPPVSGRHKARMWARLVTATRPVTSTRDARGVDHRRALVARDRRVEARGCRVELRLLTARGRSDVERVVSLELRFETAAFARPALVSPGSSPRTRAISARSVCLDEERVEENGLQCERVASRMRSTGSEAAGRADEIDVTVVLVVGRALRGIGELHVDSPVIGDLTCGRVDPGKGLVHRSCIRLHGCRSQPGVMGARALAIEVFVPGGELRREPPRNAIACSGRSTARRCAHRRGMDRRLDDAEVWRPAERRRPVGLPELRPGKYRRCRRRTRCAGRGRSPLPAKSERSSSSALLWSSARTPSRCTRSPAPLMRVEERRPSP